MYEAHNKTELDALGKAGAVRYVHARYVLAINPTDAMAAGFDGGAHQGLIHKYNTAANKKVLFVDHGTADRAEFEACIRSIRGYENYDIEYTN